MEEKAITVVIQEMQSVVAISGSLTRQELASASVSIFEEMHRRGWTIDEIFRVFVAARDITETRLYGRGEVL